MIPLTRKLVRWFVTGALLSLSPCFVSAAQPDGGSTRPFVAMKLDTVRGLALDPAGNLLVPNMETATLYQISPTGVVSALRTQPMNIVFAVAVGPDGTVFAIDDKAASVYRLGPDGAEPLGPPKPNDYFKGVTTVGCDAAGNLYLGENDVNIVRKISRRGEISIFAGDYLQRGNVDGKGNEARITRPRGLTVDAAGNVYVADEGAHIIRKVTPDGTVTTLAGTAGEKGSQDGVGAAARFFSPKGLTTDAAGNVYVMDSNNHTVRKITPTGVVTTIAGRAGEAGFIDGAGTRARLAGPRAATTDAAGNIYVSDEDNRAIRVIAPDGRVSTIVAAKLPAVAK